MIYRLGHRMEAIKPEEANPEDVVIAYFNFSELLDHFRALNIDSLFIEACEEAMNDEQWYFQNVLTAYEDFSFGIVNVLDVENVYGERDTVALYFATNRLFVVDLKDRDGSTRKAFHKSLKQPNIQKTGTARFFNIFIRELTNSSLYTYERIRRGLANLDNIENFEQWDRDFEEELSNYNHELLILNGYYQQLSEFCAELEENDSEIFDEDDLGHIRSLGNRVDRYSANMNLLHEYCNQVRSSYLAEIDIHLNEIMKIFTVVTTIFLPLSIVVGWYGMNFRNMPELTSKYGYPGVIILSLLIVTGTIWYFKKKNLM